MAHALKTFYCRGVLGTRVNPDTIGCVWTGEFDLNTLRGDGEEKVADMCERGLLLRTFSFSVFRAPQKCNSDEQ